MNFVAEHEDGMTLIAALISFPATLAHTAQADGHLSEEAAMGAAAFKLCQACNVVVDTAAGPHIVCRMIGRARE